MVRNAGWSVVLGAAMGLVLQGCGSSDGAGGSGGGAGSAGSAGDGGGGGTIEEVIHGCTLSTSTDLTAESAVTITELSQWIVPHQACVRISAGTEVTWEGNFSVHPLVGGVSPMIDEASPITEEGADSGTGSAAITLESEGTYPYFCDVHEATMQGVIYVEP